MSEAAVLALADGQVFHGISVGSQGCATGELVFNTAMTGYQEILTDPSYANQIVTLTMPHIGNTGCNADDCEADKIWASGLIVRDYSEVASNWRSMETLRSFLQRQGIVAISDIDTRQITHCIRDYGAQGACITTNVDDIQQAITKAQQFKGLQGVDLASVVSTQESYLWSEGRGIWQAGTALQPKYHVVAYDFGIKKNILRILVDKGARVTVVPAKTPADEVMKLNPDGIFLSNGPGDPAACKYAVEAIQTFLKHRIPLFGICLGYQLLALACGARTTKMKFGHHGANHPVVSLNDSNRVVITSQNHGFSVDSNTVPDSLIVTHRSLFDDSLQGIRHVSKPALGFQGHPEASPGPHDVCPMFDEFFALMGNPH